MAKAAVRAGAKLRVLVDNARLYHDQGNLDAAKKALGIALAYARRQKNPDPVDIATIVADLAQVHEQQGAFDLAHSHYEQSLSMLRQKLGDDHPDTGVVFASFGGFLTKRGKLALAEEYLAKAFQIAKEIHGQDHPETASVINKIGVLFSVRGEPQRASEHLEAALHIRENLDRRDDLDIAESLHNLADLEFEKGNYTKSSALLEKSLSITEKALGPSHSRTLTALHNLASISQRQGNATEALSLLSRILSISERTLGSDHPQLASTLNSIGLLHFKQAKYPEARALFERALRISRKSERDNDANSIEILDNLGRVYEEEGETELAIASYQSSLAASESAYGKNHRSSIAPMQNYGGWLVTQGRNDEATPLIERSLAVAWATFGLRDMRTVVCLNNYSLLLRGKNDLILAERFQRVALLIHRALPGTNHPINDHIQHRLRDVHSLSNVSSIPTQVNSAHLQKIIDELAAKYIIMKVGYPEPGILYGFNEVLDERTSPGDVSEHDGGLEDAGVVKGTSGLATNWKAILLAEGVGEERVPSILAALRAALPDTFQVRGDEESHPTPSEDQSAEKETVGPSEKTAIKADEQARGLRHGLDERERSEFKLYLEQNPWTRASGPSPSEFIKEQCANWLARGLALTDIRFAQAKLAAAYSAEISRDPSQRIAEIYTRPHILPPDAPVRVYRSAKRRVSELSKEELEERRAQGRAEQAQRRQKLTKPDP